MTRTVLIVEDDDDLRYTLAELLGAEGYDVLTAASYDEAAGVLPRAPIAAVITDLTFVGDKRGGLRLAQLVATIQPPPPVIAFTGSEDLQPLLDSGLFIDAVEKGDVGLLIETLARALEHSRR